MKKMGLIIGLALATASAAQASSIQLASIDTNNCSAALSEVRLLNGNGVTVVAGCEAGSFQGHNGQVYSQRLNTTVVVPYDVTPGMTIQLASIDTNNCAAAQSEINLLNSAQVAVSTYCEDGQFQGGNGQIYSQRLNTSIKVNN